MLNLTVMTAAETNKTSLNFNALTSLVAGNSAKSNLAAQLQSAANNSQIRGVVYSYEAAANAQESAALARNGEKVARSETPESQGSARKSKSTCTSTGRTSKAAEKPGRVTYIDCLMGRAPVPSEGLNKIIFTILMVGGMVSFMATFNGVLQSGLSFFRNMHWIYPLLFCIAFVVRTCFASKVIERIVPRVIPSHLNGLAKSVAITVLNVSVMAPIMGSIATLLLNGSSNYAALLIETIPHTVVIALLVNYFLVGPAVKMLYNNVLAKRDDLSIFNMARKFAMPWTAIFSN